MMGAPSCELTSALAAVGVLLQRSNSTRRLQSLSPGERFPQVCLMDRCPIENKAQGSLGK